MRRNRPDLDRHSNRTQSIVPGPDWALTALRGWPPRLQRLNPAATVLGAEDKEPLALPRPSNRTRRLLSHCQVHSATVAGQTLKSGCAASAVWLLKIVARIDAREMKVGGSQGVASPDNTLTWNTLALHALISSPALRTPCSRPYPRSTALLI